MKKFLFKAFFLINGLLVIFLCCIVVSAKSDLFSSFFGNITASSGYSRDEVNGGAAEIIPAIELAQKGSEHTKLVLGDSVCSHLFKGLRPVNNEYLLLGTNQAIGMMGQYLLAEQFIENHDDVTDIYIVMVEESLDYDFGLQYGYQYAVMPFMEKDLFNRLDPVTLEKAKETYGEIFLDEKVVNIIDYSPMNRKLYLNMLYKYGKEPKSTGEYTSDIVIDNLQRLKQLCEKNGVNLYILPGPMPDTEENRTRLGLQKEEFEENGLGDLMELYYESVSFYPVDCFPDGVHPGNEYETRIKLNDMVYDLQEKSGLLQGIVLTEEFIYE